MSFLVPFIGGKVSARRSRGYGAMRTVATLQDARAALGAGRPQKSFARRSRAKPFVSVWGEVQQMLADDVYRRLGPRTVSFRSRDRANANTTRTRPILGTEIGLDALPHAIEGLHLRPSFRIGPGISHRPPAAAQGGIHVVVPDLAVAVGPLDDDPFGAPQCVSSRHRCKA